MAIYTRAQKAEAIKSAREALDRLAERLEQSYTVGTRNLTLKQIKDLEAHLEWLDKQPTVEDELRCGSAPFFHPGIPLRIGGGF